VSLWRKSYVHHDDHCHSRDEALQEGFAQNNINEAESEEAQDKREQSSLYAYVSNVLVEVCMLINRPEE
jgi:hypothetical protein